MNPFIRRVLTAGLAAAVLMATGWPVRAERESWNQERVAGVASDLARAMEKLKTSAESDPEQASVLQERRRQGVLVDLRRLTDLSADLASKLKAGQGMRETRPLFDELQTVRRQARDAGRDLLPPDSTAEDIVTARRIFERLGPYYESP